jgi:hypothetical protein
MGDNINMDIIEIALEVVDWILLAWDSNQWRAVVNLLMSLRFQ